MKDATAYTYDGEDGPKWTACAVSNARGVYVISEDEVRSESGLYPCFCVLLPYTSGDAAPIHATAEQLAEIGMPVQVFVSLSLALAEACKS